MALTPALRPLLAVLLLPVAAQAAGGRFNTFGDAGLGFDSNVGNAQTSGDRRDSSLFTGGAHADYLRPLTLYTTVVARGSLLLEQYRHFDELSNQKAVGLLRILHKPDGGFFVPTFAAWASAAHWEFGSAIRDSTEYRAGAYVSQRLTTAISGRLSYTAARRDSASQVFDLRGQSLALNLDWTPLPSIAVYLGYQFHEGDIVSTGAPNRYATIREAEAVEPDDALGGFDDGQFAYRIDARTGISTAGLNYRLSPRWSFDTQAQYIAADAQGDNRYERWIAVSSVLMRF